MRIVHGNIFDSDADAIVIAVNCVGVMGKGLALAAKQRWPEIEAPYKAACSFGQLRPGGMWAIALRVDDSVKPVWLAATKDHWKQPSRIDWVESICQRIAEVCFQYTNGFAVPALGCGAGELAWADVLPIMERHFAGLSIDVYAPHDANGTQLQRSWREGR